MAIEPNKDFGTKTRPTDEDTLSVVGNTVPAIKQTNDILLQNLFLSQTMIPARAIKQRHLEAYIIFSGVAANRPSGSTEVKAYFATDTYALSIWTGTAWKSVTLS